MKKLRKLIEDHLSRKDFFEEDDELEENSLVKSTVNDLLEGNIDDALNVNLSRDFRSLKSKEFPLEDTFSSNKYVGKKISRKSLDFDVPVDKFASTSFDIDVSPKNKKDAKKNIFMEDNDASNIPPRKDPLSSEEEGEVSTDDDHSGFNDNEFRKNVQDNMKSKKKVKFALPLCDSENSILENEISNDESFSDEENASNDEESTSNTEEDVAHENDDDESEIEDDLSDNEETEDYSSFLFSKNFKDEPAEVEKGKAIKNQLNLWEVLLESRITLQKCLVTANKLPKPEKFDEISKNFAPEEKDMMIECKEKVWDLLEKLILVQDKWRKHCAEYMESRGKKIEAENTDDDLHGPLKVKRRKLAEYPEILEEKYSEFIPYRDNVIQKWNDRTKIASGKWAKSNFSAFDQPVLKQIEQIMSDKHRLIQRTFMKRSQYVIIGENETQNQEETGFRTTNHEIDREIFDDDDFYHKLLRDYIERKTSDISDPALLGRKWIHLQSLRNKTKRKVDTRRSKGRKIKFDVHPKLVNFMAPIVVDRWEDNAINELFSSVFGKNIINSKG